MPTWKLLIISCLIACKHEQSVDDAVATWSPRVEPKLSAIAKIAGQTPSGQPAPTPRLTVVAHPHEKPLAGDTVITYAKDLAALAHGTAPPANGARHTSSLAVVECWYAIKHRELGSFDLSDSRYYQFESKPLTGGFQPALLCEELDQARYLAVVREGGVAGGGTEVPDDLSKVAGTFERIVGGGVIDLYELPSGRELGRRPYLAEGSSSIVYKTKYTGVGSTVDADEAIGRNFDKATWRAIEDSLDGNLPQAPR